MKKTEFLTLINNKKILFKNLKFKHKQILTLTREIKKNYQVNLELTGENSSCQTWILHYEKLDSMKEEQEYE